MLAEHSLVVLDCDPDHESLIRGDVGTIVHVYQDGAYDVEFVDGGGVTVAVIKVDAQDVRPIMSGEILHTRRVTRPHPACLDGEGASSATTDQPPPTRPHPACLDGEADSSATTDQPPPARPHPACLDGEADSSAKTRLQARYDPATATAAYHLRYTWTGWPSGKVFASRGVSFKDLEPLWETDGMRLLEHEWKPDSLLLTFSAKPSVSPVTLAARAKGRIVHACRQSATRLSFSRKVAVRALGKNTRQEVENYIAAQVSKERFVDENFTAKMAELTISDSAVDLSAPTETARGRYWYNLHIVLVTDERFRFRETKPLELIRDTCLRIAVKKGHLVSRLSPMPDHLHLSLRATPEESPVDVVYAYQNNLAYAIDNSRVWSDSYYVGTFGEYNMNAIRQRLS